MIDDNQPNFTEIQAFHKYRDRFYCYFLMFNENYELSGVASGVLLEYRGRFVVATAGHVLEDLESLVGRWILGYGQKIRLLRSRSSGVSILNTQDQIGIERAAVRPGRFYAECVRDLGTNELRDVGFFEVGNFERILSFGNKFLTVNREYLVEPQISSRLEIWGESWDILQENIAQKKRNGTTCLSTVIIEPPNSQKYQYVLNYSQVDVSGAPGADFPS